MYQRLSVPIKIHRGASFQRFFAAYDLDAFPVNLNEVTFEAYIEKPTLGGPELEFSVVVVDAVQGLFDLVLTSDETLVLSDHAYVYKVFIVEENSNKHLIYHGSVSIGM